MSAGIQIKEPRLAVLIDADNTSARWAEAIFEEVATIGEASVRRIYGDFSGKQLVSWQQKLAAHAVVPHQQFAYTKGKNSSDIALVIDAMDLLHSGRFDGFVLVSSDSDFTRLASRVREQGLDVFGIGRQSTPESFRKACKRFIFIENLLEAAGSEEESADGSRSASVKEPTAEEPATPREESGPPASATDGSPAADGLRQPPSKAVPMIVAAMRSHDEDWVPLSVVGSRLHEANPEFDSRTYGCPKLTDLLEKTGQFEVRRDAVPAVARLKRLR